MKNALLILFSLPILLLSQIHNNSKSLIVNKVTEKIEIDGIIDSLWGVADSVSDYVQFQPYNGKVPLRRTISKILTTDQNLYCLMICYDEKENIQNFTGLQDNFAVMLYH